MNLIISQLQLSSAPPGNHFIRYSLDCCAGVLCVSSTHCSIMTGPAPSTPQLSSLSPDLITFHSQSVPVSPSLEMFINHLGQIWHHRVTIIHTAIYHITHHITSHITTSHHTSHHLLPQSSDHTSHVLPHILHNIPHLISPQITPHVLPQIATQISYFSFFAKQPPVWL